MLASYYITYSIKNEIKVAKWGTPKNIFEKGLVIRSGK
jgi:hypothetical protein